MNIRNIIRDGLPSRADEFARLLFLIEHYFESEISSEEKVSEFFQLTPSQSKSIIISVLTKYN